LGAVLSPSAQLTDGRLELTSYVSCHPEITF
jgi:hypothetical protein